MSLLREENRGRTALLTRNLVPGAKVYNEDLVFREGVDYRVWDPFRSKLAAAMIKGLPDDIIRQGSKVLYLGASTGTTASHVSDLVGAEGVVIGVEFAPRVAREFVERVARARRNVIPFVSDAREPSKYRVMQVDVVYCDIAQPDQTEIALANCSSMLKRGGSLLLAVKARSIDVLKDPRRVYAEEADKLSSAGFRVNTVIELSPFEKDHALVYATG